MEIIYRAVDGKEFKNRYDCVEYENELEEKKKEAERQKIKEFYVTLSKDFFPDSDIDVSTLDFRRAISWLESDLKTLCKKHSIEEVKKYVTDGGVYNEVSEYVDWNEIEEDANIRNNFADALRNCKDGTQLSCKLGFAFSKEDISELAKLHKSNKFRKKIEDLLTDCNFHYECGKFMNKEYDEFIKENN